MKSCESTIPPNQVFQLFFTTLLLFALGARASDDFAAKTFDEREQIATALRWIEVNPLLGRSEDVDQIETDAKEFAALGNSSGAKPQRVALAPASALDELPFAVVGKLFFRKPNGRPAACSAGFAGDDDILVTAAHCLMQRDGTWNSDPIFYHLFGSEDREVFEIECMATMNEWRELRGGEQLAYDFGFLKTGRKSSRGSLGVSKGLPAEHLQLVGYADRYHEGKRMMTATVPSSYTHSGLLITSGNTMGDGSSGSPWTAMGAVYSVSSFFVIDKPDVMWGPRFTSDTLELMNYVRRGCQ